eukprot:CAMPEP_0195125398 /NCGR_PEP_ID=MMETSP0448-20130528/132910_1 /TAXON_ID=66468 /ORGANISM="Heterocapsa triquestra, Strain CCMP 448" /LENGTH=97 /DNA_ID=CAMNT_0040163029 /DNA_START=13 /DNA_END=303 /DNA_ORIENTATION=-
MAVEGARGDVLHTGDLVLIKTQLRDRELFAEASESAMDTGYVCGDGIKADMKVLPVESFYDGQLDVREFLFMIVGQLTYIAQKDCKRYKKQLAKSGK